MPRNEDGEFELILGNRQLLSVFFIVVILLGVFFTMGYIVGRNSSPITIDARNTARPGAAEAARVSPTGAPVVTAEPPAARPADPPATEPAKDAGSNPVPERKPEPEPPAKETAKKEPEKPAEKPVEKPKRGMKAVPDQPAPGEQYLQIVATGKTEAELFVDVLAKKGFHALLSPVPERTDYFRVLVGPYKDNGSSSQAREDLEKAGFQGRKAIMRKY